MGGRGGGKVRAKSNRLFAGVGAKIKRTLIRGRRQAQLHPLFILHGLLWLEIVDGNCMIEEEGNRVGVLYER